MDDRANPGNLTPSDPVPNLGAGYKKIQRLGSGSFGEVWRGEAPGGVEVAIKVIFRSLEHKEAQGELKALELIRRLHHPYLLQTHAYWIEDNLLHIAMELADGNLRDRANQCRSEGLPAIPLPELLRYFRQAAEALDYLHSKGVYHRDIKPDNILLLSGYAKLADFGLARFIEKQQSMQATSTGTPAYMAPEVWRGMISPHSDQYSLAATFVELCLGRPLFPERGMIQLMQATLEKTPDLDPLPAEVQQVLLKALSKTTSERFGGCLEFYEALEQAFPPEFAPARRSSVRPGLVVPAATAAGQTPAVKSPYDGQRTLKPDQTTRVDESLFSPPRPVAPQGWQEPPPPAPRRKWLVPALLAVIAVITAIICAPGVIWLYYWLCPRTYLPPGCEPAPKANTVAVGKLHLYTRIQLKREDIPEDIPPVRFVLIYKAGDNDSTPFYIMEDKVSNRLFASFARARSDAVKGSLWKRGGVDGKSENLGVENHPDFPVFRVTLLEAHGFAEWLGGEIPTTRQWDMAGGRPDGAVGPFEGPIETLKPGKDIALRGKDMKPEDVKPMPVGTAERDQLINHCHDMAGNGREWTRTEVSDSKKSRSVDFAKLKLDQDQQVYLRGGSYLDRSPFQFENADVDQGFCHTPRPDISFRVVLELPSDLP